MFKPATDQKTLDGVDFDGHTFPLLYSPILPLLALLLTLLNDTTTTILIVYLAPTNLPTLVHRYNLVPTNLPNIKFL